MTSFFGQASRFRYTYTIHITIGHVTYDRITKQTWKIRTQKKCLLLFLP